MWRSGLLAGRNCSRFEAAERVVEAARRLKLTNKKRMQLLPNAAWSQLQEALAALERDEGVG